MPVSNTNFTNLAQGLYAGQLGREGDAEGVAYWANEFASGKDENDVREAFKESARTTEDNYLKTGQSLYSSFLNRDLAPGATPGTFTGARQPNAQAGLSGPVYNALYGGGTGATGTTGGAAGGSTGGNESGGSAVDEALGRAPQPYSVTTTAAPQMSVAPTQGPTAWNVDPNHTVAAQLETILRTDSPLMQQARTRAQQQMAARGGLNSTMAATAGESAMYDAAFPIASQDSSTYNEAGRFNADSANQFSRDFNAFQREKEQANFNVTANDWANAQEFGRTIVRDDRNNAFTLSRDGSLHAYDMERDEANNDFTLTRDERQNDLTLERDRLNNDFTLNRDAQQNTFQTGRDTAQNQFTLARDDNQNDFTLARDASQNQFDVARDQRQIEATTGRDTNQVAANDRERASTAINNARTNFASQLATITSNPNMSAELKTEALVNLKTTYNTIIRENALLLGWNPDSWLIDYAPAEGEEVAPTPAPVDLLNTGGGD